MSNENATEDEIQRRLVFANRTYIGLQMKFVSRLLSRVTKSLLFKRLIVSVILYGSEKWILSQSTVDDLERKRILRRIYGQDVKEVSGENEVTKSHTAS